MASFTSFSPYSFSFVPLLFQNITLRRQKTVTSFINHVKKAILMSAENFLNLTALEALEPLCLVLLKGAQDVITAETV